MNWIICKDCKKETIEYENNLCEECYYIIKNKPLIDEYYSKSPVGVLKHKEIKESEQDILGEIYMAYISRGQQGQYFTPTPVTDMMAQLVGSTSQTVSDPACGSGRMFISMNKTKENMFYVGVDFDPTCAKMAALNMWLFDIEADIYQGDSLTMKMSQLWKIRKGGFVYHEFVKEMPEPQKVKMQETLFDLEKAA